MEENQIVRFQPSTKRWVIGSLAGWISLCLCVVGIGLILIGLRWLKDISVNYELTNQRIIIKTGIIFKKIDEIELYRVKDVTVQFSLLNQMVNCGDIHVASSDNTTGNGKLVIHFIPDARAIRERIRTTVELARRERGVREIDYA